ncbi:MAG: hypothetical protein K6A33_09775 [Clostridiales bacterium]|nr:hypothetical protein [Clostridiales bacterium]
MPTARRFSKILPAALAVLVLAAFLRFPAVVREAAVSSLSRCASSLIPALFPYMTAAAILVRRWKRDAGISVFLVGLLAGFPVGAVSAAALFREGRIGKRDAERLAAASCCASPAFLVGVLGRMWGDERFGWVLFLASVPALLCFFPLRRTVRAVPDRQTEPAEPFSRDLADAIGQAGAGCLAVTSSIVFFSVLSAVGETLLPPLSPLFRLTFEFSGGAMYGASVGGMLGAALSGAAVGFSGLAVLTQVSAPLSEAGLSLRPYLLSRLVLAAWLAAVSAAWCRFHPMTPAAETLAQPPVLTTLSLCALPVLLFCLSLLRRTKNVPRSPCNSPKNLVK